MLSVIAAFVLTPIAPATPVQASQGCATPQQKRKRSILGGVLGSVARSTVGNRLDRVGPIRFGLGSTVNALLVDAIACRLDSDERREAATATEAALRQPVGGTAEWSSPTRADTYGSSTVTGAQKLADGTECRTVRDVATIDGEEQTVTKRMCRAPGASGFTIRQA